MPNDDIARIASAYVDSALAIERLATPDSEIPDSVMVALKARATRVFRNLDEPANQLQRHHSSVGQTETR